MAREFAKKFYDSAAWKNCRASYIAERRKIDGGLCETCHKKYGYIVHHKIWLSPENINDTSISLNHKHLKYDCLECHNKETERMDVGARIVFDEDGNPVPRSYPPHSED